MSGTIWAVALDISKVFNRVWSCLISSFLSSRQLWVVLDRKSTREYSVNTWVSQGSIFGTSLFLLTLMTFLMILFVILLFILVILLCTLNVIRHLIFGNNQNWLLNLHVIYEALWTGTWIALLISMLEKLNSFLTGLVKTVLLMSKWMSVLEEK